MGGSLLLSWSLRWPSLQGAPETSVQPFRWGAGAWGREGPHHEGGAAEEVGTGPGPGWFPLFRRQQLPGAPGLP